MTETEIIYNYNKAIEKANELERTAIAMQNDLLDTFDSSVKKIDMAWDGANSVDYIMKCKKERRNIEEIISRTLEVAKKIRTIAENEKRTELQAIIMANIQAAVSTIIQH